MAAGLAPTAHAAPPAGDESFFQYTTVRGDTLIGLGQRLLIEPARWRAIAQANGLNGPYRIGVGATLRIPVALLRGVAEPASVVSVTGVARGTPVGEGAAVLRPGQTLAQGSQVTTGADANVTLRLVDGTVLRLRAQSSLSVQESLRLPGVAATRSATRLDAGRVDVEAAHPRAGLPGFRMSTPQGVLGVRGTEFRVESDAPAATTRAEVLSGSVAVAGPGTVSRLVQAGYGSRIDATGEVTPPVPLLPAPDTTALPSIQERILIRFTLPAVPGARAYRAQIARDAAFDGLVADLASPAPEWRVADLPDGDYVLRVRAVDGQGLEGRDATHPFRLKARPEAPLPSEPLPSAVLFDGHVGFAWAANPEAGRYRFQLATGPTFDAPLRDAPDLTTPAYAVDGIAPGTYHWRVRSIRPDGDAGPWGDSRSFEVRPAPPVPPPPRVGDRSVSFAWEGSPGQTFEFQLARDAAFTVAVVAQQLDRPAVDLPLPGSGRFYVRLRVHDPDGFVGPWTSPQSIDLPNCLRDGSGGCVKSGESTVQLTP